MFSAAFKVKITEWWTLDDTEIGIIPPESLPESKYTLSQLHENLCSSDVFKNERDILRNILILQACLQHPERLSRELGDDAHVTRISLWLSDAILPPASLIPTNGKLISDSALKLARQKAVGLFVFHGSLLHLYSDHLKSLESPILLSLITFTSLHDPWTTPSSQAIATAILQNYTHQIQTSTFIINYLLQQFIRPLFSKSRRPEAITATGRKAMLTSAPPRRFDAAASDPENLPWLYSVPYAITVFEWAISNSTVEIVKNGWNIYVPPLLTLLDSTSTPVRSRGLSILAKFAPLLGQKLLLQTGLSEVFEDAVTPTLMFLPNLTPVDESVLLLEHAYSCLVVLGTVLYSSDRDDNGGKEEKEGKKSGAKREKDMDYWDRLLRKGVLMGYVHSSEHPSLVNILVQSMGTIIQKMGIHAVKHLKDILPILSTTLTDPFAPSHPSLLSTALDTLRTVIRNCWPRLSEPHHRIEIISALTICWKNVAKASDESRLSLGDVKRELCATGTMLVRAIEGEMDLKEELDKLFDVDPGLRDVFGMSNAGV